LPAGTVNNPLIVKLSAPEPFKVLEVVPEAKVKVALMVEPEADPVPFSVIVVGLSGTVTV
jgi:RNase P/RNase MRP subunit POP5